jgi:DNA polymerase I-like protein with 3'-5' exonuclease and polymerase domains
MEKEKLIAVKTLKELEALQDYLAEHDLIAYDVETTGLDDDAVVIGLSVAAEIDPPIGYYVVLSYWDVKQQKLVDLETRNGIVSFLSFLRGKQLIMQNGGGDIRWTKNNFGVDLMPALHTDTLELGHLLDENRMNGLKERGVELYGLDAKQAQSDMIASAKARGGKFGKGDYELYKAAPDVLAKYGAKDAILTLQVFYHDVEILFAEGLDKFFYEDESMPLLRGPTQDLNTVGLRVDLDKLSQLRGVIEAEMLSQEAVIHDEIAPHIKAKYSGTNKKNTFNIGSTQQLSWLLFDQLGQNFLTLTKGGKAVCKALGMKLPYTNQAKREFIARVQEAKGRVWEPAKWDYKKKKMAKPKKVGAPWAYLSFGKDTMAIYAKKYKWVDTLQAYRANDKILGTYVIGIQERQRYGVIKPTFKQAGTTSGRYSSSNPNFQNLPADDKRVKACIIARKGRCFVGADQDQLEARVFASISGDKTLLACFGSGDDFYSVVGSGTYEDATKFTSLKKNAPDSFSVNYPKLRGIAKKVALSIPYGTTAWRLATLTGLHVDECENIISRYLDRFGGVHSWMLATYEEVKDTGVVFNLFGRPRRMPDAKKIRKVYGNAEHGDLPYVIRKMLNLAVNHKVQSTAASIMNRSAIAAYNEIRERAKADSRWEDVCIVLQVHDELVLEGPEELAGGMAEVLQLAMENTVELPGVRLIAKPKKAYNLADLK